MKITNKRHFPLMEGLAVLIVLVVMAVFYLSSQSAGSHEIKKIYVDIVFENQQREEYIAITSGKYLKDALDEIETLKVEGDTTKEFGMMIHTVNGIRADYQKDGAYWAILLDGEPCNYGVSKQPIRNGETYSIVYTPAQ